MWDPRCSKINTNDQAVMHGRLSALGDPTEVLFPLRSRHFRGFLHVFPRHFGGPTFVTSISRQGQDGKIIQGFLSCLLVRVYRVNN